VAVEGDVTAANEQGKPAWLELALAEYSALREEILTTMQTQQGTLRFGTATLSILVVGALNVWDEELVASLAFLFAIPFLVNLVITIWMGEVTRMMRAGDHLAEVESRFQVVYPEMPSPIMRWEGGLRDPRSPTTRHKRHYEWNYLAIILIFWTMSLASMAVGVYRGVTGDVSIGPGWVWAAAGAVFLASVVGLFLILRQLATATHTQGILSVLRRDRGQVVSARTTGTS
jgi:hypothetical protein